VSQDPLPGQQRWTASSRRLGRPWAGDKPQGRKAGREQGRLRYIKIAVMFYRVHLAFIRITRVPNDPTETALQVLRKSRSRCLTNFQFLKRC
jgi:hypothetical protein